MILTASGCHRGSSSNGADGPANTGTPEVHQTGSVVAGALVFRFELFGTEGFWTDAMRLQQGIVATGVTPVQALQLGLSVDFDALDVATQLGRIRILCG